MLGGDLTVESDAGKGSCFHLTIDAGETDEMVLVSSNVVGDILPNIARKTDSSIEAGMLQGFKVLVVDDGATNRKLVSLVLGRGCAEIIQAENGKQACDLVLKDPSFHVILMDMQMPIMDGYAASTKLRESGIIIPIVALTAHAMASDKQRCMDAGCSHYLSKPIDANDLFALMKSLHGERYPDFATQCQKTVLAPIASKLPTEDEEFAEIVIDFITALNREASRLREAVSNRDANQTLTIAHWVKGAGGTAGFPCLTAPAIQLHQAVQSDAWDDVDRLFTNIEEYISRFLVPQK